MRGRSTTEAQPQTRSVDRVGPSHSERRSAALRRPGRATDRRTAVTAFLSTAPVSTRKLFALDPDLLLVGHLVAVDLSNVRLALAEQLGASAVCNAAQADPWSLIAETHGRELVHGALPAVGTDVYIEVSGAASLIRDIFHHSKFGARMIVVALHKEEVSLPFFHVMAKELTIKGAMAYPNEFPAVIEMLASGRVDVSPIITHQFSWPHFMEALAMAQQTDEAAKVMVNCFG
jgi:threonine dehydrogenase-like Zn-dependent dehydrogenase